MSKIIIIGPAYPLRGGLATFNERLARQFLSEGHEVIMYTFSLQYPSILFPGKTQYSESNPPEDISIKVIINSVNPFNWIRSGYTIKNENADIILVRYWLPFMGPCLGTILRIARKNKITKVVGLVDNALPHEKRIGDRLFTKYFVGALDGFITMSEFVKKDLALFTHQKVHLVPHPLYDNFGFKLEKNEARKKLSISETDYVYLFFGFIREYKGLDLLIEAFEVIKHIHPNSKLLVAGEFYAGKDTLMQKIEFSSQRNNILLHTHFIKDEEVRWYFSACDCVVQPYRNATQSGVTPLAYHFEVPMIVTNVGALPDLVSDELGVVCEPNVLSISTALEKIRSINTPLFKEKIVEAKRKLNWDYLSSTIIEAAK